MKTIEIAALELAPNGLPVDSSQGVSILTAIEHVIAASYPDKSPEYYQNHLILAWLAIDKAIWSIEPPSEFEYTKIPVSGGGLDNYLWESPSHKATVCLTWAHFLVVRAEDSEAIASEWGRLASKVVAIHRREALKHLEDARETLDEWWLSLSLQEGNNPPDRSEPPQRGWTIRALNSWGIRNLRGKKSR